MSDSSAASRFRLLQNSGDRRLDLRCGGKVDGLYDGHLDQFRAVRDEFVNTVSPPASSLVQVSVLVRPEWLIEVEAIAVAR